MSEGGPGAELVEELDAEGRVVGVVTRAEMRRRNLWHRNVAVTVVRPEDRVVVHQRADWKDVHPSLWDVAFGGVPAVGEDDLGAAVRELAEEAGLEISGADLVDLGDGVVDDEWTRWHGRFFLLFTDAPVVPADGEVTEVAEIPAAELTTWAMTTPLCPDASLLLGRLTERLG